jgi:hypothetical protein
MDYIVSCFFQGDEENTTFRDLDAAKEFILSEVQEQGRECFQLYKRVPLKFSIEIEE